MEKNLWEHILLVRAQSPLVHNITNYVVMNNTANALLAVGASPIMAHAKNEVTEITAISSAVVINIGTLEPYWVEAMLLTADAALTTEKPWVLDPVGAGATSFRDEALSLLLSRKPTVIRGNASEIIALAKAHQTATKGVDSTADSLEAIDAAKTLHQQYGSLVCISGATDIIIGNDRTILIDNGHALMTKVTGLGCTASAIIGAFVGVVKNKMQATAAAMALLGVAGELAAAQSAGPGSLQLQLIDKLYNITEAEFLHHLRISQK